MKVKLHAALTVMLMLIAQLTFAQGKTVTGTVTASDTNEPLPGVSVVIKGTTKGTVTDLDGKYSIEVPNDNATLVYSYIGMTTQEQGVAGKSNIDVKLQAGVELETMTVTALGLETNKDQLGTAQTTVDGGALVGTGEPRLIENLSGKSAGVTITQATGDPGAGSAIQIRGPSSITGDNQPLIVIDGVPMDNSSTYGTASGGSGFSGTTNSGLDGVTQQSRLNDLNPNDIESVEVIRGASAAALWGSRALNGVIMITTKSGKANSAKKFSVNLNSSIAWDQVNRKIPLQTKYGQGISQNYVQGSAYSWGDKIEDRAGGEDNYITGGASFVDNRSGNTYYPIASGDFDGDDHGGKRSRTLYDPYDIIFKTGFTTDNSVNFSTGNENGSVYISFGDLRVDGVIKDNSTYNKNNFLLSADQRLNQYWKVYGTVQYIRTQSNRIQMGSNLNGLFLGGLRSAPDFNQEDYEGTYTDSEGNVFLNRQRAYRNPLGASTNSIYDNPRWMMNNITSEAIVNRSLGNLNLEFEPLSWLNILARGGYDVYTDQRDDFFDVLAAGPGNGGRYIKQDINYIQLNGDLIARGTFDLSSAVNLNVLVGANINDRKFDNISTDAQQFINSFAPPQLNNAENIVVFNSSEHQRSVGYYSTLSFGVLDQLFVNLSGRYDLSSTLPRDNQGVFYPAVDVAWQFHKYLGNNDLFSFAKLRGGWGQVGRTPGPYDTSTGFFAPTAGNIAFGDGWGSGVNPAAYGGGFALSSVAGNPDLKAEIKTEIEVGLDLRLFSDRLSLAYTYYTNETKDLLVGVTTASSTGFTDQFTNAANMTNQGMEVELGVTAFQKENFSWDINGMFSFNRNEVTEINGVDNIFLNGFESTSSRAVVGEQMGVLFGDRWDRNDDGSLALDENGFPGFAATQGVIGDPNPDYIFGLTNSFNIYGFQLMLAFDAQIGMDMWNGTKGALSFFGRAGYQDWETTLSADQANNLLVYAFDDDGNALTVAQYYGNIGLNSDGSYTVRGEIGNFGDGDVFLDENYYLSGPGSGFTGPGEQFIEEGTWYRLREAKLSYLFNREALGGFWGLNSINLFFSVRNALLITNYDGNDPNQSLTGAGANGRGLDYFQNPSTRTFLVGVNVSF
jgi:TonB-linked SusC/RagA family outer membrane protein